MSKLQEWVKKVQGIETYKDIEPRKFLRVFLDNLNAVGGVNLFMSEQMRVANSPIQNESFREFRRIGLDYARMVAQEAPTQYDFPSTNTPASKIAKIDKLLDSKIKGMCAKVDSHTLEAVMKVKAVYDFVGKVAQSIIDNGHISEARISRFAKEMIYSKHGKFEDGSGGERTFQLSTEARMVLNAVSNSLNNIKGSNATQNFSV